MAKLIYTTIASLDGYVADEAGRYDWAVPDDEAHAFIDDLERPVGTTARTRIERSFDPEAVLVDECHLFRAPVVVGGGLSSLPARTRVELELFDERRLGNGMVHLRYRTAS